MTGSPLLLCCTTRISQSASSTPALAASGAQDEASVRATFEGPLSFDCFDCEFSATKGLLTACCCNGCCKLVASGLRAGSVGSAAGDKEVVIVDVGRMVAD